MHRDVLVPVLCYHHVLPKAPYTISVTPAVFDTQLAALSAAGFSSITPEQLSAAFSGEGTLPPKPVMITFDDGWRNQSVYAAPILKKHGFTATFFVYPQLIHDKPTVFMSKAEVRALSVAGFSIGSHTWSHADLRRARESSGAYAARMRGELARSKGWIESLTETPAVSLAYPYGYYDPGAEDAVRAAGYELAFTTDQQPVLTPRADRLLLGRFPVTRGTSLTRLMQEVEGGLLPVIAYAPAPGAHTGAATSTVSATLTPDATGTIAVKIDFRAAAAHLDTSGPVPSVVATATRPIGRGFHWVTMVGEGAGGQRLYAAWGFSMP